MIFKGDLSKYHPADAMMFLSQAGVDGVLSVADRDCIITLTFKEGRLVDAQSVAGDMKLIRFLHHDRRLNDQQVRRVQHIQRETGLSVRQILGKLDFFPLADIQDRLKSAMLEVLHQLFLLDQGSFNFTETQVEGDGAHIRMDLAKACLSITPRADEYRDFFKSMLAQDRLVKVNDGVRPPDRLTLDEQLVLKLAGRDLSVKELLAKAPVPSFEALLHLQQFLDLGLVSLGASLKPISQPPVLQLDPLFSAYKRALKSLLSSDAILAQLEAMISFGKLYYDNLLVLTARKDVVIHCKTIRLDPESGMVQKSVKGELGRVDEDPVFSTVHRSGIAFFGKMFPCRLLDQFVPHSPNGECALIPMHRRSDLSVFLFVCTTKTFSGLSPHHYLELLSWIVTPALHLSPSTATEDKSGEPPRAHRADPASAMPPQDMEQAEDREKHIAKMVGRIRDLPPLPTWVSQVLNMLSQPETPLEDIEALVGKDQALVAKLVQVANSALYGGMHKIATLRQVLTRLGLKTTRNLILTASTRSYFMNNRKGMRVWGQSLWQHAVETGMAARRIAEASHYPDPEEAFIGGLVHDIGKLVILMLFPESHKDILKLKKVQQIGSKQAEGRVVGCDHEQVGRLLLERWNMPDSARACAQCHHDYQAAGQYKGLVALVAYANQLSHQYGTNSEPLLDEDHAYAQQLTGTLNISSAARTSLVEAIIDDFQNAELMSE